MGSYLPLAYIAGPPDLENDDESPPTPDPSMTHPRRTDLHRAVARLLAIMVLLFTLGALITIPTADPGPRPSGDLAVLQSRWAWEDMWDQWSASSLWQTILGCVGSDDPVLAVGGVSVKTSSLANARKLMAAHPVIDGHNDWPLKLRWHLGAHIAGSDLTDLPEDEFNTDIKRIREGLLGGQFWSVYVPCQRNFTAYSRSVALVLEQIDLVKRFVARYPLTFEVAHSALELDTARRAGRVASLIGMEGGHSIDNSLGVLRMMHQLGARYMTLTHTCHTAWADSQYPEPLHGGLTPFGRSVVREMNRLGMLVDLSHVSWDTMRDALNVSLAPAFFSHSSAAALCNTTRNVPDEILLQIKQTDGVVMVNFYPRIVDCENVRNATISRIADHIMHIRNLIGARHVGLGADFDGIEVMPVGMEHGVSSYPFLIAELMERGLSNKEIKEMLGRNVIRVMAKTEAVAKELHREPPGEELLEVEPTCPEGREEEFRF
ncbi:hypothetical protein M427DRAFT_108135 [Gonapodya prolifera JEL478]|uniref:Dipeptidase n=1 Tax=Gonapodya prolifera (strain JEL478) TaxID=1344416 RepID=A0A139AV34_GONPJ|nr:hypothetical protein M427DRAFT_108135 [Gonapodya prolifera JEL478]|eukprot:KXS20606.1 hypothetical protein M427DRAFT_108135 [Gonapodya prolifera JEL478]